MKHNPILILLITGLLFAACEKRIDAEDLTTVDPPNIEFDIDKDTSWNDNVFTITGTITSVGDGLESHGHIWATNPNDPLTIEGVARDNIKDHGKKEDLDPPLEFSSSIVVAPNEEYRIKWFAVDVHGRNFYQDVHIRVKDRKELTSANFDPDQEQCFAPCDMTFLNKSLNASRYEWYLDNEKLSAEAAFSYCFNEPGDYKIKLKSFGASGEIDSITKTIFIFALGISKPFPAYSSGRKILSIEKDGYIVAGLQGDVDNQDIALMKLDKKGDVIFEDLINYRRTQDKLGGIAFAQNSLYVVSSVEKTNDNKFDVFIEQRNGFTGIPIDTTIISLASGTSIEVNQIRYDGEDLYMAGKFVGTNGISNIFFMRYNVLGNSIRETEIIRLADLKLVNDIIKTDDLGYIILGTTTKSNGIEKGFMLKINDVGSPLIGPKEIDVGEESAPRSIEKDQNQNIYIISGQTKNSGVKNLLLIGIDEGLNRSTLLPGSDNSSDIGDGIFISTNNIFISGQKGTAPFIGKYSKNGRFLMDVGNLQNPEGRLFSIAPSLDGGLIVTGRIGGQLYVLKRAF